MVKTDLTGATEEELVVMGAVEEVQEGPAKEEGRWEEPGGGVERVERASAMQEAGRR